MWGYLHLVPRQGVAPGGPLAGGADPYADRRYADVERVDYSRPGFAVVYLEGPPVAAAAPLRVRVESGLAGVRLEPRHAALPGGGAVVLENATDRAQVVTCPGVGLLRSLAPGETLAFRAPPDGDLEVFVPGAQEAEARLFAAPGPFAVVDRAGRYELLDVEPGARVLRAWHPRFPPVARPVELVPGRTTRVDLEMGVGLEGGDARAR